MMMKKIVCFSLVLLAAVVQLASSTDTVPPTVSIASVEQVPSDFRDAFTVTVSATDDVALRWIVLTHNDDFAYAWHPSQYPFVWTVYVKGKWHTSSSMSVRTAAPSS